MDDRRLLLFFAISLAILVGWQMLVPPPPPVEVPAPTEAPTEALNEGPAGLPGGSSPSAADPGAETPPPSPSEELAPIAATGPARAVVETAAYRAELDNRGAQLVSFVLKEHLDSVGEPLDLVRQRTQGPWPLGLVDGELAPHPLDEALFELERSESGTTTTLVYRYHGPLGSASKSLTFDERGLIDVDLEVAGGGWGVVLGPGIRNQDPDAQETRFANRKAIFRTDGSIETERVDKLDELQTWPGAGLSWVGMEDTHFLAAFLLEGGVAGATLQPVTLSNPTERPDGTVEDSPGDQRIPRDLTPFRTEDALDKEARGLARDGRWVLSATGAKLSFGAYFGPKEFDLLADLGQDLEKTVEWGGILRLVVRPLLAGLNWLHDNGVPNYGWAIVLMTIGLKILLFPLTHKSYVSMQKMQKLQPQMKAIRQKYRGKMRDKSGRMNLEVQKKMNEEMQALFRSEGASPTGGCLPMLLQMPIFFAFFRLLSTAVELRHEPWVLWVQDLSAPDPVYVLPVLMGASQILQQKLTPMSADPMQRKIVQLFPWMFTIFALSFPSGLVLYWTVNNIFTIAQTAAYKKWRERKDAEEKLLAQARKAERKRR